MTNNRFQSLDSGSGRLDSWVADCPSFAEDKKFLTFRSHPTMRAVVDGSPVRVGRWHLRRLKKNPFFHSFVDKFSMSDTVGSPKNLIKFKSKGRIIYMNPTTLRYVNNTLNLIELFGDKVFAAPKTIVEIGGGYGGDCKIANDFIKIGKRWCIFDLNSSIPIMKRWLKTFGYEASFNPDINSLDKIDLLISNAAFSEMWGDMQKEYFEKIILRARNGYLIENFDNSHKSHGDGFSRLEFINLLKNAGKHVVILDSNEWLTGFDAEMTCGLIVFSESEILIPSRHLSVLDKFEVLFRRIVLPIEKIRRLPFVRRYTNAIKRIGMG